MPTPSIDFARLSLCDALDLAILIEEEAMERYMVFADEMESHHTPQAAAFFRFMSANEAKHGGGLVERRKKLFGNAKAQVHRSMIFDVEAPNQERARPVLTLRRALLVALQAEEKAHTFFAAALPHLKDAQVRAMFDELAQEEVKHQELVRAELAKVLPEPGEDAYGVHL